MKPQVQQKLNDYIRRISSDNPNDWPKSICLDDLGLTDEDIQPLRDAISSNPNAAREIVGLYLSGNQLTSFSGEGLGGLELLYLNNNKLIRFSGEGLGTLKRLELNFNQLTSFSGEGLGALQALILSNNKLTSFRGEGLGALQELFLLNNQLTSFSGEGLGALQALILSNNKLTSFRGEGLGALQELFLLNNQLTSFEGEGLGALQELILVKNQLTSFSSEGLEALQRLNLEKNQLTSFSGERLGALRMLDLTYNQLTSFKGEGLGALRYLRLSGNELISFRGEGLGALQWLGLSNNQLTSVCKIMLEAMRPTLQHLDYSNRINQQALTNEMLTEHFNTVLNATQRELNNTKSWLSMVRRIRGLPDELCRMVFECVYGLDHIPQEMNRIKRAFPGQMQNLADLEESDVFAEIKKQFDENISSLYEDSFKDAQGMKTLLTAYRRWGKYTTNLRYLQDNSRLDPRDNPFQLALCNRQETSAPVAGSDKPDNQETNAEFKGHFLPSWCSMTTLATAVVATVPVVAAGALYYARERM